MRLVVRTGDRRYLAAGLVSNLDFKGLVSILESMDQPVVSTSREVMGGTPVFTGTRVPVQTLLDYLEAGERIDDFLEWFPSVTRAEVIAFLEQAKDRLIASAS